MKAVTEVMESIWEVLDFAYGRWVCFITTYDGIISFMCYEHLSNQVQIL